MDEPVEADEVARRKSYFLRLSSPGKIEVWLRKRREDRMLKRYGGLQDCPWCKQCAQDANVEWRFDPWPDNPFYDQLTCGVCGGTSLWMWGLGMHFQRPLSHPALATWEAGRG